MPGRRSLGPRLFGSDVTPFCCTHLVDHVMEMTNMLPLSNAITSALIDDHQERCAAAADHRGGGLTALRNQVGRAMVEVGMRIAVTDRMGRRVEMSGGRHHA